MYFPGTTQEQIDNLAKRVVALEDKKSFVDDVTNHNGVVDVIKHPAIDQNEYQNHANLTKSAGGHTFVYSGSAQGSQMPDTPKKNGLAFRVAFKDRVKANVTVDADSFYFTDGFALFSKNPSLGGFNSTTPVAAYPASEISSVTKL